MSYGTSSSPAGPQRAEEMLNSAEIGCLDREGSLLVSRWLRSQDGIGMPCRPQWRTGGSASVLIRDEKQLVAPSEMSGVVRGDVWPLLTTS